MTLPHRATKALSRGSVCGHRNWKHSIFFQFIYGLWCTLCPLGQSCHCGQQLIATSKSSLHSNALHHNFSHLIEFVCIFVGLLVCFTCSTSTTPIENRQKASDRVWRNWVCPRICPYCQTYHCKIWHYDFRKSP